MTTRNVLSAGDKIQWYEIVRVLGQGGFGITYLALDTNLNQQVALKEYLPSDLAARTDEGLVQAISDETRDTFNWGLARFISEAQTLARFDHPNIVRVNAVFEANNTAYMVMRFEAGAPLSQVLDENVCDEAMLKRIALALIDGLAQVHAAGFIHRDIKPANIYIRADGSPVLLDFGSARQALNLQTRTLTSMVSPGYAPYEQYMTDAADQGPWTDIYALGATFYRATCGKSPLSAVDRSKSILKGSGDFLVPAASIATEQYSASFLRAIDHALAFDENDRPQTLSEWRAELLGETPVVGLSDPSEATTHLRPDDEIPAPLTQPTTTKRNVPEKQRRGWLTYLVVMTAALMLGGASMIAVLVSLKSKSPASSTAEPAADQVRKSNAANETQALLEAATQDLQADRLTEPADDNAYAKYQEVLSRDPANRAAKQGLAAITIRYLELAADSARARNWPRVRHFLGKARKVDPDNEQIDKIESRLKMLRKQSGN